MSSQFVVNAPSRGTTFFSTLRQLAQQASALDIAVSYVQVSGWELIEQLVAKIEPLSIRLLLTDQFSITHPEALRKALERGIQIRNYGGSRIYHPKVYLVYDAGGRPKSAIVGSANISESGLSMGVEAGAVISDPYALDDLKNWFEQLFADNRHTTAIDRESLKKFDRIWHLAAAKRVKIEQIERKRLPKPIEEIAPSPGEVQILEDLFSTIELLCNGSNVVCKLSSSDFVLLSSVISKAQQLPTFLQKPILEYQSNKGGRSWDSDDRKTMLLAWQSMARKQAK